MKKPVCYTPRQAEQMQEFIEETFGDGDEGIIGHEIKSEYVHTDVLAVTTGEGDTCFATCGMGARQTNAPLPSLCRTELLMYASEEVAHSSREEAVIMGELQRLSKYPFKNNTFFGPGHTIDASAHFAQTFGFSAFVFLPFETVEPEDLGQVQFLLAVPIYQEERKRMMEDDPFRVIRQLQEAYEEELYHADSKRGCS